MTDYPLPDGAELVSDRLIAGRYRIIHFPVSGRYALLQKDGMIRIIPHIINNIIMERNNV